MRRLLAALVLLAGCASPAPAPPDAADRAHLQQRLRDALDAPFVLGKFYAEYEVDGRVKVKCKGTARAFRSDVVMIEEESESGPPLRLLRVGDRAWMYKEGWQDAAGTAWEGLGAGFQDPYEVLAVLDTAAARFVPHWQGGISCPDLKGADLLRPLSNRAGVHPPKGAAVDGVLKRGFSEGPLVTRFSAETGPSTVWIAKMDIVSWGPAPPMTFDDIPAPFTPDMKAAVRKATEGK